MLEVAVLRGKKWRSAGDTEGKEQTTNISVC